MKPGYKTTEFWVTAAVCAGAFAVVGFRDATQTSVWADVAAIVVAGLAALGYTGGRMEAKRIDAVKHIVTPPLKVYDPNGAA